MNDVKIIEAYFKAKEIAARYDLEIRQLDSCFIVTKFPQCKFITTAELLAWLLGYHRAHPDTYLQDLVFHELSTWYRALI